MFGRRGDKLVFANAVFIFFVQQKYIRDSVMQVWAEYCLNSQSCAVPNEAQQMASSCSYVNQGRRKRWEITHSPNYGFTVVLCTTEGLEALHNSQY